MQQVNLYTIEFRRHEQPLSSQTLLWAVAACYAVLIILQAASAWRLLSARDALANLEQEAQQVSARLEVLKASQPVTNRSGYERELAALRADIQRRQELQSLISQQSLGNTQGFSSYMEGLARQAQDDLWLTQIRLLNGGRSMEMAGWTRKAELVPFYLQQLRNEQAFDSVRFGVLGIRGREAGQPYLQFSLLKTEDGAWQRPGN